jgi:hypothetical protein
VLGVAGMIGIVLAIHGYGRGAVPGTAGTGTLRPSAPVTTASGDRARPTSQAGGAPKARPQKLGPLLSSTPYAPYAFEIYPTSPSGQAQLAMTGFKVQITRGQSTITVRVSTTGSPGGQSSTYAASDRVYFIETSLGDDSGDVDYNVGDDGLVITNSAGRIVE